MNKPYRMLSAPAFERDANPHRVRNSRAGAGGSLSVLSRGPSGASRNLARISSQRAGSLQRFPGRMGTSGRSPLSLRKALSRASISSAAARQWSLAAIFPRGVFAIPQRRARKKARLKPGSQ